ncbi:MAG: hypothetical protein ACYC46_05850 [Acidobacteriaceae bacterium]
MQGVSLHHDLDRTILRIAASLCRRIAVSVTAAMTLCAICVAQDVAPLNNTIKHGYTIQQSVDLGGHIADYSGSGPMYDTLVNLQSGPRILGHFLEMHAVPGAKHLFFDNLTTSSFGYGGDPNNMTILRMSKGKLYDFRGLFRRDRQYFDYNLLANPLIPATSNTYVPALDSPHLFNTVRRMTDVDLTFLPLSVISFRAGYSQNVAEGPSYSSVHFGADALLLQNWRNSTDTWTAGVDWKAYRKTLVSYDEIITHYKGDTNWQLAGLNYQLANGTPASLGIDIFTAAGSPCAAPIANGTTTPPTINPACNGYLQYTRYQPARTLLPTEELRFQSSDIKNIQLNGRIRYTGASMDVPEYNEYFNGLQTRGSLRAATITGSSKAQRINVSADFGVVWQISSRVSLSDQYDFWDFRQSGMNTLTEVDQGGTSMLTAPGTPKTPVVTTVDSFMGQKTHVNTLTAAWQASARASFSLGYRYRNREIVMGDPFGPYTVPIHEQGAIFGAELQPVQQWRINSEIELIYADESYTQISPRQLQHYRIRTTYKPVAWTTLSGTFNDLERRDNVTYVNHLDHSRSVTFGASVMPNEHYGFGLNYGYIDVFTQTDECYTATPAPVGAVTSSPACVANGTPYLTSGYYDAPTQYGSIDITLVPVKKFRSTLGYRMNAVNGTTVAINLRQVPGSLQSQYQSPYATIAWTLAQGWIWKADWNYYSYGEGTPIGPTSPRSFRGNVYTLGVHHDF